MTYTSHADLGGRPDQGPVVAELEGALFHSNWERRAFALTVAMGATGSWNLDMSRSTREILPNYADLSYYEIWIHALQKLMEQRGLVHADEIQQGRMIHPAGAVPRVLPADQVAATLARGSPTERPIQAAPRFQVGQRVRTRSSAVPHHTRLPGYVRGKQGVVEMVHGAHVFADTHAQELGEQPQWLYTVVFDGRDVWGEEASPPKLTVSIDAWEPYLEPM